MKLVLASAVVASLAISSAFAADLPVRTVAPVVVSPVFTWTGVYAGVNGGYAVNSLRSSSGNAIDLNNAATGGAQLGYNYQAGSFVLGLEASINYMDLSARFVSRTGNLRANTRVGWYGVVGPRLGVLATDRMMIYVTGGMAYGQIKSQLTSNSAKFTGASANWHVGASVGAGIEYALTDAVSIRASYDYMILSKKKRAFAAGCIADAGAARIVRAGLSYRF